MFSTHDISPQVQLSLERYSEESGTFSYSKDSFTQHLNGLLSVETHSYDNMSIWVALLTLLWFFFRVRKFTITKDTSYNSKCYFLFSDSVADNCDHPQPLKAAIKQSKTDINVYLGATNGMLFAVESSAALSGNQTREG